MRGEQGFARLYLSAAVALAVSSAFLVYVWSQAEPSPEPTPSQAAVVVDPTLSSTGRVVDSATGRALAGASVTVLGETGSPSAVDAAGEYSLDLSHPTMIRVAAPGHSPQVLAVAPGEQRTVDLVRRDEGSLSLRFGGDVMLGRRFYEPADHGQTWLHRSSGLRAHAKVLDQIQPLLADADLTIVNLETSLVDQPYFSGTRPRRFHPDKDLVFASAPVTARALKEAGVDVVDLGNNHVYDALADGLDSTIRSVEEAGLAHFGAGRTPAEAWEPAYVRVRGQRVAFIGCTTVTGSDYPIKYVTGPGQGGAAECLDAPLRAAVEKARASARTVVVMMHGGVEYQSSQDTTVRALTRVATLAGATLVVNGHPHVVGGITEENGVLVAETMGNLVFDQNLWSTLRSYLLRVDLQDGRRVRTQIDPFALADYAPVPTTGLLADSSARVAAGLLSGPLLLGTGTSSTTPRGAPAEAMSGASGDVVTIPPGTWFAPGQRGLTAGQDLLYGTGGIELMDTGESAQPLLWTLGKYTLIGNDSACSGSRGLHAVRQPARDFDVVAFPSHRVPVTSGESLTLTVDVARATEGAQAEIRWYAGMAGPSKDAAVMNLGPFDGEDGCRQFTIDVRVPPGITAAQPYLRLADPGGVTKAGELMADNVRLVRWSPEGIGGRIFDTVRFGSATTAQLSTDRR